MTLYSPSIETLPNELQLIAVERPYGKTFALALALRVGSFDDPPRLAGMAHFCEHLAFRGQNQELVETLTRLGVAVDAYTAYDFTLFTVRGHVEHLELALKFIGNVLQREPRTADEIAAEGSIVRHEFGEDTVSSREVALDRYWRASLGDPQWKVTRSNLRSIAKRLTADVVNSFLMERYHPSNARLAVVAPLDPGAVRRSLENVLASEPQRQRYENVASVAAPRTPRRITISVDPFKYAWVYFFYVVDRTDIVTRLTAMALSDRLGHGPHSELFQRFRTNRPLAYSVYADDHLHLGRTAIYCHTAVPGRSVKDSLNILLDCETDVRTKGFTAEELQGIKRNMILNKELHLDYPEHLAAHLAYEALRPPDEVLLLPEDHVQRISNMTLQEVNDTARAILCPANRFTFIGGRVGPFTRWHIRRKLR
jgi:predicted Zn-dependent peptidase